MSYKKGMATTTSTPVHSSKLNRDQIAALESIYKLAGVGSEVQVRIAYWKMVYPHNSIIGQPPKIELERWEIRFFKEMHISVH